MNVRAIYKKLKIFAGSASKKRTPGGAINGTMSRPE